MTDGESSYTYAYDGDGNRISKTVNGETTEFVYVDGKLLGLQKGQDKLQFLYDETDTAYGFIHNDMPYYYDINLQGEIVGILDWNNNYVVTYIYDVWGALVYVAGDYSVGFLNPLRYRGYFYDDETGFYYLQSRYYDPEVGRFISADNALAAVDNAEMAASAIEKLPSADDASLDDKSEIDRVKALIDGLTANEKAMLGDDALSKVDALDEKMRTLAAGTDKKEPDKTPDKSGDAQNAILPIALCVVIGGGAAAGVAVFVQKRKRSAK